MSIKEFYRPGMRQGVREFIRECDICQRNKTENIHPTGLLQPSFDHKIQLTEGAQPTCVRPYRYPMLEGRPYPPRWRRVRWFPSIEWAALHQLCYPFSSSVDQEQLRVPESKFNWHYPNFSWEEGTWLSGRTVQNSSVRSGRVHHLTHLEL